MLRPILALRLFACLMCQAMDDYVLCQPMDGDYRRVSFARYGAPTSSLMEKKLSATQATYAFDSESQTSIYGHTDLIPHTRVVLGKRYLDFLCEQLRDDHEKNVDQELIARFTTMHKDNNKDNRYNAFVAGEVLSDFRGVIGLPKKVGDMLAFLEQKIVPEQEDQKPKGPELRQLFFEYGYYPPHVKPDFDLDLIKEREK